MQWQNRSTQRQTEKWKTEIEEVEGRSKDNVGKEQSEEDIEEVDKRRREMDGKKQWVGRWLSPWLPPHTLNLPRSISRQSTSQNLILEYSSLITLCHPPLKVSYRWKHFIFLLHSSNMARDGLYSNPAVSRYWWVFLVSTLIFPEGTYLGGCTNIWVDGSDCRAVSQWRQPPDQGWGWAAQSTISHATEKQ